jgi:hypothetical protein
MKHEIFVNELRKKMKTSEINVNKQYNTSQNRPSLEEILRAKFNELFYDTDDDNND